MTNWINLFKRILNCCIHFLTALLARSLYLQMTDREGRSVGWEVKSTAAPALGFRLVSCSQGCLFKTSYLFLLGNSTRGSVCAETPIPMTWNNKVCKHSASTLLGRRGWKVGMRKAADYSRGLKSRRLCFLSSFPFHKNGKI